MKIKNVLLGSIPLLVVIFGVSYLTSGYSFEGFTSSLVAWGTLMLALATFLTIRENRRLSAISRIRSWAEKSIQLLTIASPSDLNKAIQALKTNIQIIRTESLSALADAEVLGGEVKKKVQKAVHNFNEFTDKAESDDKSINFEALLKNLLGDFSEVINSASKL